MADNQRTPLYDFHVAQGAKMVPFAGYDMPVQYPLGVMKEHLHTRAAAGLFDVSHMGQVILAGPDVAEALEALVPVSVIGIEAGRQRYGIFTNQDGGILDDLMIANTGENLFLVVNAACKVDDIAHLRAHLPDTITVTEITDRALLALQGPSAQTALERIVPEVSDMRFMDSRAFDVDGSQWWISRSGYTGEDGFEISLPAGEAVDLAERLVAMEEVEPIGLGARDSLRLEAGLCLYGHDIDTTTSPVEGNIAWAIQKVRRNGGARAGGFPGAQRILAELDSKPTRIRVGLLPEGRAPMREGVVLFESETAQTPIGTVTSGGFGPTVGAPVAMGYVPTRFAAEGTALWGEVRGKRLPLHVAPLPFHPANYKR
ncbi:glycine cleavage system aminomethyltransferase GcvT [Celeribacter arenosi]